MRAYFFVLGVDPVANSAQAKKRARQNETRRRHNASQRSAFRTAIKKTISALDAGDYEAASSAYLGAVPIIDRAVTHGIIQKNKAARHKSRLNARSALFPGFSGPGQPDSAQQTPSSPKQIPSTYDNTRLSLWMSSSSATNPSTASILSLLTRQSRATSSLL